MGNAPAKVWRCGDPDRPDPVSGLTRRDISLIQRSWAPLWANVQTVGQELFKRLFRADSETKCLFKAFRNLDDDALSKSREFKAHVVNVMSSINMVVTHLQEPDVAIAMLHKLGDQHRKHHVIRKYFETFESVIEEYLKTDLKLPSSTLTAWSRFFTFANPHIFKSLSSSG